METENRGLADKALDAFWDVIVQKFPEAKHGDLSPLATHHLTMAAETAIDEWIKNNVPRTTHTPGPWSVDRISPSCAICIKPYPGRIVCDIEGTDAESEANASLIATAPELLESLESLTELAECVARNWENSNLAGAVKNLGRVAHEAAELARKARQVNLPPPSTTAA